ncbi:hypothetical protein FHW58_000922 [Duganella sp. 1224]|uniref:hypothetical protein n=1 Tax=Duganella sp. 1224 TaxID=2587052 RepID=UPI0015CC14EA|nr:hypothetical protein [Duganella sp. 1224]NYE59770.1 hypothetical protein [Duganella sp. 1224]
MEGWRLIDTLLCAPKSAASKAYIASHAVRKINYQSSGTGEEQEEACSIPVTKDVINALLAAWEAWNATVQASPAEIQLSYYPNEACIHSRTLELVKGKWRITAMGSACD